MELSPFPASELVRGGRKLGDETAPRDGQVLGVMLGVGEVERKAFGGEVKELKDQDPGC